MEKISQKKKPESWGIVVSEEEIPAQVSRLVRTQSKENRMRGSDEVLVYFSDGEHSFDQIFKILTHSRSQEGLYDYFSESFSRLKKNITLPKKLEVRRLVKEELSKAKLKYHQDLEKALEALERIDQAGYSKEFIIALLDKEPLSRWPKVVERILKNR